MSNQEMEYRIESLNTLSFSKVGSAGAASEASRVKSVQQGRGERSEPREDCLARTNGV